MLLIILPSFKLLTTFDGVDRVVLPARFWEALLYNARLFLIMDTDPQILIRETASIVASWEKSSALSYFLPVPMAVL